MMSILLLQPSKVLLPISYEIAVRAFATGCEEHLHPLGDANGEDPLYSGSRKINSIEVGRISRFVGIT